MWGITNTPCCPMDQQAFTLPNPMYIAAFRSLIFSATRCHPPQHLQWALGLRNWHRSKAKASIPATLYLHIPKHIESTTVKYLALNYSSNNWFDFDSKTREIYAVKIVSTWHCFLRIRDTIDPIREAASSDERTMSWLLQSHLGITWPSYMLPS